MAAAACAARRRCLLAVQKRCACRCCCQCCCRCCVGALCGRRLPPLLRSRVLLVFQRRGACLSGQCYN